jgi:hypothetical protein
VLTRIPGQLKGLLMRSFLVACGAVTVFATSAGAQEAPFSVHVNATGQSQGQDTFVQGADIPLYRETGSWEASHAIDGGGASFDVGGAVRLGRLTPILQNLSVGVSYRGETKHTRDVTVNASVPSPIFHDSFRSASTTISGLEHTERAVHLQALWHVPVTLEFDVTLFAGPSFFTVRDELLEGVVVSEAGGDFTSVNVEAGRAGQRNSAVGFNVGVDTRYMFTRHIGAGAMLRYSRGSIDLTVPADTAAGGFKIDTGGPEIAAGLRLRF